MVDPSTLCVCPCKCALNLGSGLGALNMDTSLDPSKPGLDMQLKVVKLEDAYLEFTQMADVSNIGT